MAREPRQQRRAVEPDVDAMLDEMNLADHYRADLLKELAQSYEGQGDRVNEAIQLHGTLYHWWWQFMKAHRLYSTKDPDVRTDREIAETMELFGDINRDFRDWWIDGGRDLFQEQGGLPLIRVVDMDRNFGPDEFPASITLKIPLTIPRDGIVHQLDKILAICHSGPKLKRHSASTARLKINPKPRYRIDKLPGLLKIWTKVQSEPYWLDRADEEWWEIAQFMGTSKFEGEIIKYDEYDDLTPDIKRELGRSARRLYDQANRIMSQAIRGVFPSE